MYIYICVCVSKYSCFALVQNRVPATLDLMLGHVTTQLQGPGPGTANIQRSHLPVVHSNIAGCLRNSKKL